MPKEKINKYTNYTASHKTENRGEVYADQFDNNPRLIAYWKIEKDFLKNNYCKIKITRYLDFACGTGRLSSLFENFSDEAIGIDVSEPMLNIARKKLKKTNLINYDLFSESPPPIMLIDENGSENGFKKFELITAFRFFPNAEDELKEKALHKLFDLLSPGGILIINNHGNYNSLDQKILRLFKRDAGFYGMTDDEMENLISKSEFRVKQRYKFGLLPLQSFPRLNKLIPPAIIEVTEKFLTRFGVFKNSMRLCIYVLEKPYGSSEVTND